MLANRPPSPTGTGPARAVLALLLLLAGISCVVSFGTLVLANLWPGPFEDYWADMPLIEAVFKSESTFGQWILAHNNAHRILLPRLLFVADYGLAEGSNLLLAAFAVAVKLALLVFLNHLLTNISRIERLALNTLMLLALFNHALVYHIVFSVNIQWELMILLSCLAIAALHRSYQHSTSFHLLAMAYALALCAMLTHAGGFFCLPVFALMAWRARRGWRQVIAPVLLFAFLFYLTFYVLPMSHTESSSWETILLHQFIMPTVEMRYFFQLLSLGIHRELPALSIYFSFYVIALGIANILMSRRSSLSAHPLWAWLALFLLCVMFITSAARISWEWNAGSHEPRFRVLGICLLLILTLQGWQLAHQFTKVWWQRLWRGAILAHATALLLITHSLYYQGLFLLSNNTLATHSYMLLKGATRDHGLWLGRGVLFREETDPLARSDAFFRQHGLAWYHNKVLRTPQAIHSFQTGDSLLTESQRSSFEQQCLDNPAPREYHAQDDVPAVFDTVLAQSSLQTWWSLLHRDSYFTLDNKGRIIGYAFLCAACENKAFQFSIRGMALTPDARYIAEIVDNQPTCLYRLIP